MRQEKMPNAQCALAVTKKHKPRMHRKEKKAKNFYMYSRLNANVSSVE